MKMGVTIMSKLVLSLLIAVCALRAADNELPPASAGPVTTAAPALKVPGENPWRTSIAVFAAAEILAVQSSWGKRELNPNLSSSGDTFGAKGALIQFGILGGVTGIEYLVLHHAPRKAYTAYLP
jgi:hypothetical protein